MLSGSVPFCKATEMTRQVPVVPSGDRRPNRTGVCASQREVRKGREGIVTCETRLPSVSI
jgi:hypothetical protein